ncbi:MAG: DNA repair protein RecN [Syntrophorhabdus sp.]|nr:DNA repair protein RecN [Syntrophorhabdus sp.]
MLTYLGVKGFAIIDELRIEFGEGFNVITGETGAGKSIVINALATLMNAKSAPDAVRSSSAQAEVVGHFMSGEEEYILKRVIGNSGRSRAFLNDEPITLARMEALGAALVSVYGQNEFQHLLEKDKYTGIVDRLLGLEQERERLSEKVEELRKINAELTARKREAEGKDREMELLEFQALEIEKKNIGENEEETLKERLKVLKGAERIGKVCEEMTEGLQGSEQSAQALLKRYSAMLRALGPIEAVEALRKRVEGVSYEIEDLLLDIRGMERTLLFDEEEMMRVEDRLSEIFRLKDKYGNSREEIEAFSRRAKERLIYLRGLTDGIDALEKERERLAAEVEEMSSRLSERRRKGAPGIARTIVQELGFLSMKGLQFQVLVTDKGYVERDGRDDIELLISTNPGEPLKPLRKIASGGELSRIMLAIKKVIGGEEEKALIFDEVDAGIGGRVADMVGRRLKDLSGTHQVLCITHLPQIAAYGDRHFLVEKQVKDGRTTTAIHELAAEERVQELARMLGGATITDITIKRAREMLQS